MMKSWQGYLEKMMVQEMRTSEEERLCAIMTSKVAKKILDEERLERSLTDEYKYLLRTQE